MFPNPRKKPGRKQDRYHKRLQDAGLCILCRQPREEDRPGHTYYKSLCRFHGGLRRLYRQRLAKSPGWNRHKPGKPPYDVPVKDRDQLERMLGRK